MGYFEQRRQEEENKQSRSGNKDTRNLYIYMLGTFALAAGVLAASYFWLYRPEHKQRADAQRNLNNTRQELVVTQAKRDSLGQSLAQSDSLNKFYIGKINRFAIEGGLLRKEIKQITVQYDSTRTYLEGQIAAVSDTLSQTRQQRDSDLTKLSSLETMLNETKSNLSTLSDSASVLYRTTLTQQATIADKNTRIQELTPRELNAFRNFTFDVFAQTSQERAQQGYGFGCGLRLLGGSNTGFRLRGDVAFNLDKDRTDKNAGLGLYLKDKDSRVSFEVGGGADFARYDIGSTTTKPYIYSSIDIDAFWIKGLGWRVSVIGNKERSPTLRVGTSFLKE